MSLTSSLADPASPLSRFLADHLPRPQGLLPDLRRRLAPFPAPVKPESEGVRPDYALIGHSIDHRLRISLGAPTGGPIACGVDLARIDDDGWPSREVTLAVQAAGHDLLAELRSYDKREGVPLALAGEAEDRLVRLCHVASGFETIYRLGGFVRGNSLGRCAPDAGLEDLLAAVPATVVDDVRRQMMLAADPGPFPALRELPSGQRICGPVFEGGADADGADADGADADGADADGADADGADADGADADGADADGADADGADADGADADGADADGADADGADADGADADGADADGADADGADADFILGGCLIDCKATIRPEQLGRAALYQLAGYLLLDYHDTYRIRRTGLYLSRQGALIDWDIDEFLRLLGARVPLPDLRAACHQALTGTAVANTARDTTPAEPCPPPPPRAPLPRPRHQHPIQETLFD
ncbi:pentapeptide repeat-containing protein [Streptomyces sp. NBC_01446]|uniref:pentapeptide repeat-containing protein n=1 Tax=Streptomyces sp. NBC_01446 TaxID=2903870 RepID=UPI002257085C|nr:pentapeptide repeat-containing protein [Streptomyces sp. NBC_01446]MCX4650225.1 pentapeptide repeat-containing protein [Streptomyces sp. NBC_01446]